MRLPSFLTARTPKLSPEQEARRNAKQEILSATVHGDGASVEKKLKAGFIPDRETLMVAAAMESTAIFRLIAEAGIKAGVYDDLCFAAAHTANDRAHKSGGACSDMGGTIRRYRGQVAKASLQKRYGQPCLKTNAAS
jgi:hypothetical protein